MRASTKDWLLHMQKAIEKTTAKNIFFMLSPLFKIVFNDLKLKEKYHVIITSMYTMLNKALNRTDIKIKPFIL